MYVNPLFVEFEPKPHHLIPETLKTIIAAMPGAQKELKG